MTYDLTQNLHTSVIWQDIRRTYLTYSSQTAVLTSLSTPEHSLVSLQIDAKTKASTDFPFDWMIFPYTKSGWDSFRSCMTGAPLSKFFKQGDIKNAAITEYFLEWRILYTKSKFQQKPNIHPWLTLNDVQIYLTAITTRERPRKWASGSCQLQNPITGSRELWKVSN